jgi:hypothetical protein
MIEQVKCSFNLDCQSMIAFTKLLTNIRQIVLLRNQQINMVDLVKNEIRFQVFHFSSRLCSQEAINKNPTVWLDGARPANTCIPPYFLENGPKQPSSIPTPKVLLQV